MEGCCVVRVLKELRISSVCIPEALEYPGRDEYSVGSCSLFDPYVDLDPTAADYVWRAGFRFDCHSKAYDVWHRYAELDEKLDWALWFVSKGLSTSDMDFHLFMDSVCIWPYSLAGIKAHLCSHEERLDLFWDIYSSPVSVDHQCACSVDGCIPALSIFKSDWRRGLFGLLLAECCGDRVDSHFWNWLAPRMIRCFLFHKLDLTHSFSCCQNMSMKYRIWDFSRSWVKERQEEEWYLRSRLDSLVQGLVTEYEELDISLSKFLDGRVRERALEVLEGEQEPSEEDIRKVRDIGVVLEAE